MWYKFIFFSGNPADCDSISGNKIIGTVKVADRGTFSKKPTGLVSVFVSWNICLKWYVKTCCVDGYLSANIVFSCSSEYPFRKEIQATCSNIKFIVAYSTAGQLDYARFHSIKCSL